jgi:hypothetical protein
VWRGQCGLPSPNPLRGKTEPDMVSRPHPVSIAKRRAQQLDDLGEHLPPLRLLELLEEGTPEGLEPSLDADIELCRARHEHDGLDQTALLEQPAIFGDRGKEQGATLSGSPLCKALTARMAVAMAPTLP